MKDEFDWSGYVDAMSALYGLNFDERRHAAVVDELRRIHAITRALLDFPLAAEVEPAPIFRA